MKLLRSSSEIKSVDAPFVATAREYFAKVLPIALPLSSELPLMVEILLLNILKPSEASKTQAGLTVEAELPPEAA